MDPGVCPTELSGGMTERTEAFTTALAKVNDERGSVYGHPSVDLTARETKGVVAECADPLVRHALEIDLP